MAGWMVPIERLVSTRGGAWFFTHVAGYDVYQTRTARQIGVFVLDPA